MKKLNRKADDHYHRTLVKKYGLVPWRRLLEAMDEMMSRADKFFKNRLLAVSFQEWFKLARTECQLRNELADNLFKRILLCRGWRSWRKVLCKRFTSQLSLLLMRQLCYSIYSLCITCKSSVNLHGRL